MARHPQRGRDCWVKSERWYRSHPVGNKDHGSSRWDRYPSRANVTLSITCSSPLTVPAPAYRQTLRRTSKTPAITYGRASAGVHYTTVDLRQVSKFHQIIYSLYDAVREAVQFFLSETALTVKWSQSSPLATTCGDRTRPITSRPTVRLQGDLKLLNWIVAQNEWHHSIFCTENTLLVFFQSMNPVGAY